METFERRLDFPDVVRDWEHFKQISFDVCEQSKRMAAEVVAASMRLIGESKLSSIAHFLELAFTEIFYNAHYHDQLDIHGPERDDLVNPAASQDQRDLLWRHIELARGRCTTIRAEISETRISVEMALQQDFPGFAAKWQEVTSDERAVPDGPTGMGFIIISGCFPNAEYDSSSRRLRFWRDIEA